MGALASSMGHSSIFLLTAGLTIPAFVALAFVRKDEIDYDRARNAGKDREGRTTLEGLSVLVKNPQLLWFAGSEALFQLADASMLTLAVSEIGRAGATDSSLTTAAMLVAPQIVVALLAPWIGYFSELWGRRPLLVVGFAIEIVRAVLFIVISDPFPLIAVQALNGISGATRTVLLTVIVADLTTGTGRFNLARGGVGLVSASAAAISTTLFGFIAQDIAPWVAFLGMAVLAAAGGLVVWFRVKETRPATYVD
jgi:MFS family permease